MDDKKETLEAIKEIPICKTLIQTAEILNEKNKKLEKENEELSKCLKQHLESIADDTLRILQDNVKLKQQLSQKEKEIKADRDRTIKEVEKEFIARMDRSNWVKGKDWFHLNHFKSILTDIKNKGE